MKKQRAVKTRASGTMTESAFWRMIQSVLRKRSMFWLPIRNVKDAAKRDNQSDNKRLKFEYRCAECNDWFPGAQIVVDHVIECGQITCAEHLPGFVTNLFCEEGDLQVLCTGCHLGKTNAYIEQLRTAKTELI